MASNHTPTPWELLPESVDPNGYHLVVGGAEKNYGLVATVTLRDDAALIVAAVNAYQANTARLSELEAEVARLRSALEPFADIADLIESETEGFSDTDELQLTFHDYLFQKFSVAMFKRARAALRSQS